VSAKAMEALSPTTNKLTAATCNTFFISSHLL
jgi:hypothetical protein